MSKDTKLVQIKEEKKNFFKFNILFKKRVSITKIKIKNLTIRKDFKIGLLFDIKLCILSLSLSPFHVGTSLRKESQNNSGIEKCNKVDIKKYNKKIIKNQYKLLNL